MRPHLFELLISLHWHCGRAACLCIPIATELCSSSRARLLSSRLCVCKLLLLLLLMLLMLLMLMLMLLLCGQRLALVFRPWRLQRLRLLGSGSVTGDVRCLPSRLLGVSHPVAPRPPVLRSPIMHTLRRSEDLRILKPQVVEVHEPRRLPGRIHRRAACGGETATQLSAARRATTRASLPSHRLTKQRQHPTQQTSTTAASGTTLACCQLPPRPPAASHAARRSRC